LSGGPTEARLARPAQMSHTSGPGAPAPFRVPPPMPANALRPLGAMLAAVATAVAALFPAPAVGGQPWSFAVSGDSRDCGNLVMPAIASAVHQHGERFYWHLGDLRRIRGIDADYVREKRFSAARPSFDDYLRDAWPDFAEHQVRPFGDTPFFLGIGNHETIPPKTRAEFEGQFKDVLDRPEIRSQRERDASRLPAGVATPARTYYHWIADGVDFVNLDNAVADRFDDVQLRWFDAVVAAAVTDRHIRTLVVGMHEALPHSLSDHHSMCSSDAGILSGEHVYRALVDARRRGKHVYVLASHSHYYLEDIYSTAYWKEPGHGGTVLPGWVVGTAGAVRYPLPVGVAPGPGSRQHVYGYVSGRVERDRHITFSYRELGRAELGNALPADYEPADAAFCFEENPAPADLGRSPPAPSCLLGDQGH
jgi:hypothetical protein